MGLTLTAKRGRILGGDDAAMLIHCERSATTKMAPFRRNPLGAGGSPRCETEAAGAPPVLSEIVKTDHDEKTAPAASVTNLGGRSSLRACNPKTPARGPRDFCHGLLAVILIVLSLEGPAIAGQQPSQTESALAEATNPLAELKDEVGRILTDAGLPFTAEQERGIVLMTEDRRRASEDLFGDLMDFRAGPTQGQEADRLRSAIEWMRGEFLGRLQDYLTPEQLTVWSAYAETVAERQNASQADQALTQYVRINNNAFTSEDGLYRFGQRGAGQPGPQVVDRGGQGAFHGNVQLLFKDEALNARNPFAENKPPYQERQFNFDISGPIIPRRLTTSFAASHNEAENVDTIHATLPEGVFALGITRPVVNRLFTTRNTYQVSQAHSVSLNLGYTTRSSNNQGVGGFALPELASTSSGADWNVELVQFSRLNPQSLFESRLNVITNRDETEPFSDALRIDVLDAFTSGGAQNRSDSRERIYDFSSLYTQLGEKVTIRAGGQGHYQRRRSLSENNFGGTFTFSTLDAFLSDRPLSYRVTRGDPLLETDQVDLSFFLQNDWKVSPQLTLMIGARYYAQSNLGDYDNLAPRLGFAYALGRATVIRGGGGQFYVGMPITVVEDQRRLDGTRQFEIVIDNPSFPDPFQAGTVRDTLPSIRVMDPNIESPYINVAMIQFERTFLTNMFISATYGYEREYHRLRLRNLNAPFDSTAPIRRSCRPTQSAETCVRPDPSRGDVLNREASANLLSHTLLLSYRQRFRLFSITASYLLQRVLPETSANSRALPSDNYNLRLDYTGSHGTCCPTHTLNSTVNAQLPLGVFLTGTMSLTTPNWYNITTGRDDNRDSTINDRPPGFGRNGGKGPKTLNFDFNISKAIFFGSNGGGIVTRTNLNVFANMTNAFNRTNLGRPSGVMTSPNFGKSTSALDPRQFEVGLRFQF